MTMRDSAPRQLWNGGVTTSAQFRSLMSRFHGECPPNQS
jgi:hypothetical protein